MFHEMCLFSQNRFLNPPPPHPHLSISAPPGVVSGGGGGGWPYRYIARSNVLSSLTLSVILQLYRYSFTANTSCSVAGY